MAEFKNTSFSEGFGIFNKVSETEFDVVNQNRLRLFMLNTENKLFNYDELYQYILSNITRYVFDRRKSTEIENDPVKRNYATLDAISHFRDITSDDDKGAGGELGEILLYLFLEQDMGAPKLFSKVELKTGPFRDNCRRLLYSKVLRRSRFYRCGIGSDGEYDSLLRIVGRT